MEFLKEILGEELFGQFSEKVNAYNGDDNNKEKQIKLGNLATGEYVGKGKHDALQALLDGKTAELDTANALIADLKKTGKDDAGIQTKISDYETQVQQLQQQLQEVKTQSAIKVALLSENALDIDYLTYKLESKLSDEGKAVEIDEHGNIKGWNDLITGLKTQFPTQFSSEAKKNYQEKKLPNSDESKIFTKQDLLKMPYAERNKFFNENPETYSEIMKGGN